MRVKVRCLRKRGQRISRTEITNSPVVIGEVQTHQTDYQGARYFVANVSDPNNSVAGVLCELFEPVLYNPSLNKMARRGFEANGYVQERLLELVSLNHAYQRLSHIKSKYCGQQAKDILGNLKR